MATAPLIRPRVLGVVFAGGAVGVVVRALLVAASPADAVPWATLAINLAGSLLLGIVVGWLDDRHPLGRAFLGTGVMGGFTTYSAFAVQTAHALATPWTALLLAAASLLLGVLAAAAGLFIGRRIVDVPGEVEPPEDAG